MALPLFFESIRDDLMLELFFGVHFFEPSIFIFKGFYVGHERGVHAAKLGAPLVECGGANAVLAAKLGQGDAIFRLF